MTGGSSATCARGPAACARGSGGGVRYAYTGNVHDPAGQSTFCHHCGTLLIERDWYRLGAWRLTGDGRCANCDTPLAGVLDSAPGTWGPRRLPVRLASPARPGRTVRHDATGRLSTGP